MKRQVAYYYDDIIGLYKYADGHPMKPHRVTMTDELIRNYDLLPKMKVYDGSFIKVDDETLTQFHADEYIQFIKTVTTENKSLNADSLFRFNFGEDSPVFDGLYDFCRLYTVGADLLNNGKVDIAINWAGGLHHAKRHEASGFCYINDCVLAIVELLKRYERVLYLDIDIHHGDGVEEAFYLTDRVMTCSFHKFGDYFPGTGHETDIGYERGVNHAINFPLLEGVDDFSYVSIFKPVLSEIMTRYRPDAIVMQCGADSISGDKLGCFNLSIKGHGECVSFMKSFGIPMLVMGGGGYTLRNVARCWAYETGLLLDQELANDIPENDYREYFCPEYKLHIPVSNMENLNLPGELERIKTFLCEKLTKVNGSSGLQISSYSLVDNQKPMIDVEEVAALNRDRMEDERADERINLNQTPNLL